MLYHKRPTKDPRGASDEGAPLVFEHELNEFMTELKFDHDIYGDMMKAVTETREKMLNAASEHYGIPKEEIERQVEQIDAEVRKEHPETFII